MTEERKQEDLLENLENPDQESLNKKLKSEIKNAEKQGWSAFFYKTVVPLIKNGLQTDVYFEGKPVNRWKDNWFGPKGANAFSIGPHKVWSRSTNHLVFDVDEIIKAAPHKYQKTPEALKKSADQREGQ